MADTTEPTNEALIARIAYLTERAEKAEATMERLGLVEDVTFDAADNSVSEWKNIRAEATEAELARTREALKERPTFAVSVGHMKESHRETWLVCIEREGFKGGILNMNVEGGYITPSQHLIKEHAEYEANEWRKFFGAALAKPEPADG